MNSYPNPSGPTVNRFAGYVNLQLQHNPNARNWVNSDRAGIVITIRNLVQPEGAGKVKGTMKIYDVVGNPVTWMASNDLFGAPEMNGRTSMDIYWNGLNNQGMKVAPGIYRAVLYLDYPSSSRIGNVKGVLKLGVTR
jgi:hypothetical protein